MVEAASSGASVLCLCEKGDAMIMEETGKIFKKEKEMKKGEACSNAGALLWAWWVPAARGQRGRKGCPLLELARCSQRAPLSPAHTITSELELRVSSLPKMRGTGGSAALGTVTWCHLNVPPSSLPCALEAWGPFCKCLVAGDPFYSVGAWVKGRAGAGARHALQSCCFGAGGGCNGAFYTA